MDILEAISRRVSVRTYQSAPASAAELETVRLVGESAEVLAQIQMQFLLQSHEQMGREVKGIFGDYGKTIRAPHYIVLVSKESEGYLTDAGFRFEQMILEATRLGLCTCWVGLMFKESSLRACLGIDKSWRVLALTPIGRTDGPSFVSRALRAMARSSTRRPLEDIFFWHCHGESLPAGVLANERLLNVLEAVRWAPSWLNRQPWRFIFAGREILVYKMRRQVREGKDYHLLDCGIAMSHLHLAARAARMEGRWELGRFDIPGASDAESIGRYLLKDEINP